MLRNFILSLILLTLLIPLEMHGTGLNTLSQVTFEDTLTLRSPNLSLQDTLLESGDFEYRAPAENPDSLWDRLVSFLFQVADFLSDKPWVNFLFKAIIFTVMAYLLVSLIRQWMGGNINNIMYRNSDSEKVSLENLNPENMEIDLEEEYQKALERKDYHEAVRYLYLHCIHDLNKRGLLNWKSHKSNQDYIYELQGHDIYKPFFNLTRFYDYVEYGDFEINQKEMNEVLSLYKIIASTGTS